MPYRVQWNTKHIDFEIKETKERPHMTYLGLSKNDIYRTFDEALDVIRQCRATLFDLFN